MGQVSILEDIAKRAEQATDKDDNLREIPPVVVDRSIRLSCTRTCKVTAKAAPARVEARRASVKPIGRALDMNNPLDVQHKLTNILRVAHPQLNAFEKAKRPIVVK